MRLSLLAVLLLGQIASAAEITVSAAASTQDALQAIAEKFGERSGDRVRLNFAGSNVLARQIEAGAPVDVYVSADEETMDELEKRSLLLPGSRQKLLSNRLVLIVPADSGLPISRPADLAKKGVTRIALADPRAVPAGRYARAFLEKAGLWPAVAEKIIPTGNVRATLAAVASGNADAGIVYRTDAASSDQVRVVSELPREEVSPISYPVAIVADAAEPETARRFIAFLGTETARRIFVSFGFTPATP